MGRSPLTMLMADVLKESERLRGKEAIGMNDNETKTPEATWSLHGLPPEIRAAADALSRTYFYGRELRDDGEMHSLDGGPTSLHEALIYLMKHGLKPVLAMVKDAREKEECRYDEYRILMSVSEVNPNADSTSLDLYDEGSPERLIVEHAPFWEDDDEEGMPTDVEFRAWSTHEFACSRRNLMMLTAAEAALKTATERSRWTWKQLGSKASTLGMNTK
jgi:hypothetical protein